MRRENTRKMGTRYISFNLFRFLSLILSSSFYMAPEVTMGGSYDNKIDVFSFGILMFVVLAVRVMPYVDMEKYSVVCLASIHLSLTCLGNQSGF